MGVIKKLYDGALPGQSGVDEVYPVTSSKGVIGTDNEPLDVTLDKIKISSDTGLYSVIQKTDNSEEANQVQGNNSSAFGKKGAVVGNSAFAAGEGLNVKNDNEVALGKYNISNNARQNWLATAFTLGDGNGGSAGQRSNLLEIKENGYIYVKNLGGFNGKNGDSNAVRPLQKVIVAPKNIYATEQDGKVPTLDTEFYFDDIESQAVRSILLRDSSQGEATVIREFHISKITSIDEEYSVEFLWCGLDENNMLTTEILTWGGYFDPDEREVYTIIRYRGYKYDGTELFDYSITDPGGEEETTTINDEIQ